MTLTRLGDCNTCHKFTGADIASSDVGGDAGEINCPFLELHCLSSPLESVMG